MEYKIEGCGDDEFTLAINEIIKSSIFCDPESFILENNPWKRPIRPQTFKYFAFESSNRNNYLNYSFFTANRLLTAINELNFLFLNNKEGISNNDFKSFYSEKLRKDANQIKPKLQSYVFNVVNQAVNVDGSWTKSRFIEYFENRLAPLMDEYPRSFNLIKESNFQQQGAELLLIQHAVDFLVEASHMSRYTLGDYGELQSQLFRVLLDEFGYGVHSTKHSTLFKNTLKSVNLNPNTHAYWQFYLNTSLLLNNYFHMITSQPENFFKYIGAITLAENTFGPYCKNTAELLKTVYGTQVDVDYYMEHAHIDKHHGRMTYEDILLPAIDLYGDGIIQDIVLGIEQTLYLQSLAEDDLCKQIIWMSKKLDYAALGDEISYKVRCETKDVPIAKLIEPKGELSVTHVHDGDELCYVSKGKLQFVSGPNSFIELTDGQAVVINRNRLHGALVLSDECHYEIHSIGDYQKYANRKL